MNLKNLAMWVIIVVLTIGLYNMFKNPQNLQNKNNKTIIFSEFLTEVDNGRVVEVQIQGKTIKKWDKVAIWYTSGNRDEDKFEDPDKLNIEREDARQHLSFGFGIHRCLGNRLADLQLKILWEEILERFTHIEITGETKYLNSSFIRGITEMPVIAHRK